MTPNGQAVLDVLHEPRFVDPSPAEIYATLLDDGRYLCSERTMYRVLDESQEVRERRDRLRHPHYARPSYWPRVRTSCGVGTSANQFKTLKGGEELRCDPSRRC